MFVLWRQDDNGNRFIVGRYADRAVAERQQVRLTRSLHKQTYWIAENEEGADNGLRGQVSPTEEA